MARRILYISYTGLLDPLGASQVLQYVLELAQSNNMTLLTFEKPQLLANTEHLNAVQKQCADAGVNWQYRIWHNKPGIPATIFDILAGRRTALKLARKINADVVHCRSYIGGMMGLYVKRKTGAKYVFDMRGFWPDERVDGGIWTKSSAPYRVFKHIERNLFLGADHIVSLTKAGIKEFEKFDYLADKNLSVSVIPTCTNLDIFKPVKTKRDGFTIGYVGSAGSWYMFDEVAKTVKALFEMRADARFLVVNKGGHDAITKTLIKHGVDMTRVTLTESRFDQVADFIGQMDAGIFYIKPAFSKRASCPTRMGEFLACGKPCITNIGCGDVEQDFNETGTGIPLPINADGTPDLSDIENDLAQLINLSEQPDMAKKCRETAQERFSLKGGVAEYNRIYEILCADKSA